MSTPSMRPAAQDVVQFIRGFLMGSADIVPGVSGGTVALILGIYQRLVAAISRCDAKFLQLLAKRNWREAAQRIDLRFLAALGAGILTGVASFATLMHYLLDQQRTYTLAVFFGLILASSLIVARMVRPSRTSQALACIAGGVVAALFALWLVQQEQLSQPPDHLAYYFFCGMIAICAMILPGVSGAFVLLLLGVYEDVTGIIKAAVHMEFTAHNLFVLAVFASGCAIGLIGFSKILRRLLETAHAITMAVLCGFMIGSLWKLWPFQRAIYPQAALKDREYQHVAPMGIDEIVWKFAFPALIALVAVLAIESWSARQARGQTRST